MKKFAKIMALTMVVVLSVLVLASCGINEKTAEKINNAAKEGEAMSIADVKKLCGGDPTFGVDVTVAGVMTWVSGCKNAEDVKKKLDDGKKLKSLTVTFVLGKATLAVYGDYTPEK